MLFNIGSAAWKLEAWKAELFSSCGIGIPYLDKECNDAVIFGFLVAWFIGEVRIFWFFVHLRGSIGNSLQRHTSSPIRFVPLRSVSFRSAPFRSDPILNCSFVDWMVFFLSSLIVSSKLRRSAVHCLPIPRVARRNRSDPLPDSTHRRGHRVYHSRHFARSIPLCRRRRFLQQSSHGSYRGSHFFQKNFSKKSLWLFLAFYSLTLTRRPEIAASITATAWNEPRRTLPTSSRPSRRSRRMSRSTCWSENLVRKRSWRESIDAGNVFLSSSHRITVSSYRRIIVSSKNDRIFHFFRRFHHTERIEREKVHGYPWVSKSARPGQGEDQLIRSGTLLRVTFGRLALKLPEVHFPFVFFLKTFFVFSAITISIWTRLFTSSRLADMSSAIRAAICSSNLWPDSITIWRWKKNRRKKFVFKLFLLVKSLCLIVVCFFYGFKACGSDITIVTFIIMPAKTNNYNVDSLRGQAVVKQLRDTVKEAQESIGKRIFDICLR